MEGLETKAVALMNYVYEKWYTFAFPKLGYFADFFSILYYSPEGSVNLRWAGGGAQRPVLRVFGHKGLVRTAHERGKTH